MSLLTVISNPFVVTSPGGQGPIPEPRNRTPLVIVPGTRQLEVWFDVKITPVDSSFFTPTNYTVSIEGEIFFPELVSQGEASECIILIFSQNLPVGNGYLTIQFGIMEFPDGGVNSDEPFAFYIYESSQPPVSDCFCIQKIRFLQQDLQLDRLDESDAELKWNDMELPKHYAIKAGDTFPPIIVQALGDDGEPLDLTGYSVTFVISEEIGARPIVNRAGTILPDGKLRFDWLPGETDNPGNYLLEIILKKGTQQFTLPGAGYAQITITPRLWSHS